MPYDASPENPVYQTLLESTRAIPWKIDWRSMTFAYIGPQIEELLGWSQASWVSANDWAERMHPEDRERVVNFCVSQSREGTDHEADYRALTSSGDYVWIRDVVHVVRDDNGEVDSLVGFMFDISERKRAEEQLIMLQRQLEEYSYKDGLTGVANRRMFDSVLDTEWGSAQRSGQPISLVLLDIDYFKQFNDHYGHIQGDDCLRSVGKALAGALHRPRDFIARFGGEEFVLVLPETDSEAARQIAERCRSVLREQRIAHEKSAVSDLLTISLGVGTAVPASSDRPLDFVAAVDRLLYQAKQAGRDRLVAAQWSRGDDLRRDAVRTRP
ncbi:sensor domain-containing diguanylate cyclase [Pseudomonas sp. PDM23]|uniref:GGDEF domain-containing protein n=1 Tax=unclassified Pseudomonas TaxID=196821 RepID=UPI001783CD83|nr:MULTISPECIES: sensor domain-containing diguanylate cyclase [unclassified Pseudomonas]MBD9577875.1 sensor domain-containing diguanylate cyclase [Pseudomonas sp. PDM23]MBD9672433.1 sensor domain-containing diguanylate cyclase [Pseudomonas sp. PDM21]